MADVAIGVVLVNWNGADDTLVALDSLAGAHPRPARVVVVDNGSRDDSVARLTAWIDAHDARAWVHVVALAENRGFPGGNNAGLEVLAAEGVTDAFLLLNNDTTVAEDFFARLADGVAARPDAGLYGTTIYEWDRETVWYAGGTEHPIRALVLHQYRVPTGAAPRDTEFVTGCSMLIPRTTYARLGGLSEVYFPLYWEDAEYSVRARRTIGPLVYLPGAVVYHRVGATVGMPDVTPRVAYVQNHHRAIFVRRNYTGARRAAATLYLLVTKPARCVKELLRGNARVGWAILRGSLTGIFVSDPNATR